MAKSPALPAPILTPRASLLVLKALYEADGIHTINQAELVYRLGYLSENANDPHGDDRPLSKASNSEKKSAKDAAGRWFSRTRDWRSRSHEDVRDKRIGTYKDFFRRYAGERCKTVSDTLRVVEQALTTDDENALTDDLRQLIEGYLGSIARGEVSDEIEVEGTFSPCLESVVHTLVAKPVLPAKLDASTHKAKEEPAGATVEPVEGRVSAINAVNAAPQLSASIVIGAEVRPCATLALADLRGALAQSHVPQPLTAWPAEAFLNAVFPRSVVMLLLEDADPDEAERAVEGRVPEKVRKRIVSRMEMNRGLCFSELMDACAWLLDYMDIEKLGPRRDRTGLLDVAARALYADMRRPDRALIDYYKVTRDPTTKKVDSSRTLAFLALAALVGRDDALAVFERNR